MRRAPKNALKIHPHGKRTLNNEFQLHSLRLIELDRLHWIYNGSLEWESIMGVYHGSLQWGPRILDLHLH